MTNHLYLADENNWNPAYERLSSRQPHDASGRPVDCGQDSEEKDFWTWCGQWVWGKETLHPDGDMVRFADCVDCLERWETKEPVPAPAGSSRFKMASPIRNMSIDLRFDREAWCERLHQQAQQKAITYRKSAEYEMLALNLQQWREKAEYITKVIKEPRLMYIGHVRPPLDFPVDGTILDNSFVSARLKEHIQAYDALWLSGDSVIGMEPWSWRIAFDINDLITDYEKNAEHDRLLTELAAGGAGLKELLFFHQTKRCAGCSETKDFKDLEIDHVIPKSNGGSENRDNKQLLCSHCNRVKGNRSQVYLKQRLFHNELGSV